MATDTAIAITSLMSVQNKQSDSFIKRVGANVFENPPRISVIILAINSHELIGESLNSVISQKYREHEIILVNDGSLNTEQLERAIKLQLENIIYIRHRNTGQADGLNTAIEHARGEFVAFLEPGDIWQADFLASQYVHLTRHDYDMVYCDAILIGTNSAYRQTFMETSPSEGEVNLSSLLKGACNVLTSGTIARKQAVIDAGFFGEQNSQADNIYLWMRMAKNGAKIGFQKKQLLKHRVPADALEPDRIRRIELERETLDSFYSIFDLGTEEKEILAERIKRLDTVIAIEQGNTFLRNGNYLEAVVALRVANRHLKSLKLTAIIGLLKIAPQIVLKYFKNRTAVDPANFSSRI